TAHRRRGGGGGGPRGAPGGRGRAARTPPPVGLWVSLFAAHVDLGDFSITCLLASFPNVICAPFVPCRKLITGTLNSLFAWLPHGMKFVSPEVLEIEAYSSFASVAEPHTNFSLPLTVAV